MMGHREMIKGAAEEDVFSSWRVVLCYTKRPGVAKAVKAKFNRRIRKVAKKAAWDEVTAAY